MEKNRDMKAIFNEVMRKITLLIVLMIAMTGRAANVNKVVVDGREFYVYEVKNGDTMYGVSHGMNWDVAILKQYNPGSLSPLKKGRLLFYPVVIEKAAKGTPNKLLSEITSGSNKGGIHTIVAGETLYGVARDNDVSVEALMKANPGISATHFQAGDKIRIPSPGTGVKISIDTVFEKQLTGFKAYKIARNDSWESVANNNGISLDELKAANKGIEFKRNKFIGIPVVSEVKVAREVVKSDPREETLDGIQDIYEDINGIGDADGQFVVKVAIVADEPSERKDKEFIRGFLTAINRLKNSGQRINLKVFNGTRSSIDNIDALDEFKPTIVFFTNDKYVPGWLSEYAETSRTPLVNTFDVKSNIFQENPYLIQLITPPDYFNEEIAEWYKNNYDGYTLVLTGDVDKNDALAEALVNVWNPQMVRTRSVDDLKKMPLAETGKYLLYSFETKRNEVKDFLTTVEEACNNEPLAKVAVIGRPNWILYDESLEKELAENNVMIPSRFYLPKDAESTTNFNVEYRQLFDRTPQKTFPVYAAVGYDAANYFINSLGKSRGDINALTDSEGGVQSDYSLSRPNNWIGMVNKLVYIVRFTPFDRVDKIKVK